MADDRLLREREENWNGFVRFVTISTALVIATLGLMALFLL